LLVAVCVLCRNTVSQAAFFYQFIFLNIMTYE